MKFYKIMKDDAVISIEARPMASTDSNMIEISEEEYNAYSLEFEKLVVEENATPTYEELLAENEALEAENAALLYQVLTGEELADV